MHIKDELEFDTFIEDVFKRKIRFSFERKRHIESNHPEMFREMNKINATLQNPDIVVQSKIDDKVELFYRNFKNTPVGEKYLCVAVKAIYDNCFIITSYFTDAIKKGELIWQKKK